MTAANVIEFPRSNTVTIPCADEAKYMAVTILRNPTAYTKDQVLAAIETLEHERDWETRRLVSTAQNRYLWAVPGSDIVPADAPQSGDNFRRLNDDEMAAIGMAPRKQMVRPDIYADFTEAAADSAADLRKLFFPGCLVVLAGLAIGTAIGEAIQWAWRAL